MIRILGVLCLAVAGAAPILAQGDALSTAQRQFEAGNYSSAITTLQSALGDDPQNPQAQFWLARCYYELRDFSRTITSAQRAIQSDPQNGEYHQWLGRAYGERAEQEHSLWLARKVRRELEEAVRLSPENVLAHRDLLDFYVEAPWIAGGSREKARSQAEAIQALDRVSGHLAWAAYWQSEKKADRVEAEYRRVFELRPNRIEPYLEIADHYQHSKEASGLEVAVEAAARTNASDPRIAYYRGVVRVLTGNSLADAERWLRSYATSTPRRSNFPSHESAREWLGRLYELQGKPALAAEQYRVILKVDPERRGLREALRRVEPQN